MIAVADRVKPAKYGRLLAEAMLVTIRSEAQYERALKAVNSPMSKPESKLTRKEDKILRHQSRSLFNVGLGGPEVLEKQRLEFLPCCCFITPQSDSF